MDEIASIAMRTLAAPAGVVVVLVVLAMVGRWFTRIRMLEVVVVAGGLVAGDWLVRGFTPLHLDGNRRLWAVVVVSLIGAILLGGSSMRRPGWAAVRSVCAWVLATGAVWFVTQSLRNGRWRDWTLAETVGLSIALGAAMVVVWIAALAAGRSREGAPGNDPKAAAARAQARSSRQTLAQLVILAGATASVLQLAHVSSASQYAGSIVALIFGLLVLALSRGAWSPRSGAMVVIAGTLAGLWLAGSLLVLDPPRLSFAMLALALPMTHGVRSALLGVRAITRRASRSKTASSSRALAGVDLGVVLACAGVAVVLAIPPAPDVADKPDALEELYSGW